MNCPPLQNSRYREEVLDLSSRNLQLSNDNAELSAHFRGDQESVRILQERLAVVSKEQEEKGAEVRQNSITAEHFSASSCFCGCQCLREQLHIRFEMSWLQG